MSRRSGPSGEFQIMLPPAEARTALLSARQMTLRIARFAARIGRRSWQTRQHRTASRHRRTTAPLMPMSSGMNGSGKRTSAGRGPERIAAQRVACVQIARTEAGAVEAADGLAALVEQVEQAHVLAAPALIWPPMRAADERDLLGDRVIVAPFAAQAIVLHVAAEARELAAVPEVDSRGSGSSDGCGAS